MRRKVVYSWVFPKLALGFIIFALQGCYSASTPLTPAPSRCIDTWLLGIWEYKDTKGHRYQAGIFPLSDTEYSIELRSLSGPQQQRRERYFRAFISRVDRMCFLNLFPKSPISGAENSVLFVHYQLQSPIEVVVTPIQLRIQNGERAGAYGFTSQRWITPWQFRQEIRRQQHAGILLPPSKSTFWKKTSEVYWQKNASLVSQPQQALRIPIPNPNIPSQDQALQRGTTKGYRKHQ